MCAFIQTINIPATGPACMKGFTQENEWCPKVRTRLIEFLVKAINSDSFLEIIHYKGQRTVSAYIDELNQGKKENTFESTYNLSTIFGCVIPTLGELFDACRFWKNS